MSVSHPSELLSFLESIGAAPKKNLSQNFLIHPPTLQVIVDAIEIEEGEPILEIGPGPGALTEQLLKKTPNIWAIEKDPLFAQGLLRLSPPPSSLQVIHQDFLKFPLLEFLAQHGPMKVVGNLPYHIATPIIEILCQCKQWIPSAVIMVQEEMKDRFLGIPGTKSMGSFTVFLQAHAHLSLVASVPRHCFYPAPSVHSSVVKLSFLSTEPPSSDFFSFVRRAFQQRRKMLRSSLKLNPSHLHATHRPEQLSLEDWKKLYSEPKSWNYPKINHK